jgi:nucleoside 2-deoxyribosyltransferase
MNAERKTMLESLQKHFEENSAEQIQKQWDETLKETEDVISPTLDEFMDTHNKIHEKNMKQVYKAPETWPNVFKRSLIFLAGAIDMGKARDWQTEVTEKILEGNDDVIILNPRRDDWDDSWEQTIENKQFREQVEWELKGLDEADLVILVLTKDSKAPISLLELGLQAKDGKVVVVCEDGFYRKGNIEVVCKKYNVPLHNTLEELYENL